MLPRASEVPPAPRELVDAFRAASSRVVLLVGAGLSMRLEPTAGRRLPSWTELLKGLFDWANSQGFSFTEEQVTAFKALLSRGDSRSLIHAGGWLRMLIGERFFYQFMTETFSFVPRALSQAHQLLARLPLRGVVTFNYDCLLETALGVAPFAVTTEQDPMKLFQIQMGTHRPFLLKAHGDVSRPETIVFGHNDYRRVIMENAPYRKVLSAIFEQNVVLMIGFGLEDPDVEYILDDAVSTFPTAPLSVYALIPKGRINPIIRDLWLRDGRLRLLEYEPRTPEHREVDEFLRLLLRELECKPLPDSAPTPLVPLLFAARGDLEPAWESINERLDDAVDVYSLARERAQLIDNLLKRLLHETLMNVKISVQGFALVARGGYGRGHLSCNSDIDITVLHEAHRRVEAETVCATLFRLLDESLRGLGLRARPLINTIDECREHWRLGLDSLASFASSRLIQGDLCLHITLREAWRDYIGRLSLEALLARLREERLAHPVEDEWPSLLNIKTCAGGLLDVMLIHFLEEVLNIKGLDVPQHSATLPELASAFNHLLRVREQIYSMNGTLVLSRSELSVATAQSTTSRTGRRPVVTQDYSALKQSRQRIRNCIAALLSARS